MNDPEVAFIIHSLEVYQREIEKEGDAQLVTLARFFAKYDIPVIIEKLKRSENCEHGKAHTRTSKEPTEFPVQLHQSGHSRMFMRTIPD